MEQIHISKIDSIKLNRKYYNKSYDSLIIFTDIKSDQSSSQNLVNRLSH